MASLIYLVLSYEIKLSRWANVLCVFSELYVLNSYIYTIYIFLINDLQTQELVSELQAYCVLPAESSDYGCEQDERRINGTQLSHVD